MKRRHSGADVAPKFKLWLSSAEVQGIFGDGKWRLLDAIDRKGSLKAAAKILRMSYRKAWGDLRKAEESLGVTLIEKQRGGSGGGRTELTEEGRAWLHAYSSFRSDIEKAVAKAYRNHIRDLF